MERIEIIIYSFFVTWMLILTVFFFSQKSFLSKLTKDFSEKELRKILKEILNRQKKNTLDLVSLRRELGNYKEEGKRHVQRFSLIRFNPFQEIGGEHSFSVAVLDGNGDGFVMTGLHTRERTRVYSKSIKNGKSKLKLSKEEQQSLEKALKS